MKYVQFATPNNSIVQKFWAFDSKLLPFLSIGSKITYENIMYIITDIVIDITSEAILIEIQSEADVQKQIDTRMKMWGQPMLTSINQPDGRITLC